MIAVSTPVAVSPKVVAPPKQTKLLGATLKGVGLITTVGVQNVWRWALVERPDGSEAHVFIADLKRDQLVMPAEPMPYREVRRRVGVGLWDDCYELELVELSDLTHDLPACPECLGDGFFVAAAGWTEESYTRCEGCGGTGKVDESEQAA